MIYMELKRSFIVYELDKFETNPFVNNSDTFTINIQQIIQFISVWIFSSFPYRSKSKFQFHAKQKWINFEYFSYFKVLRPLLGGLLLQVYQFPLFPILLMRDIKGVKWTPKHWKTLWKNAFGMEWSGLSGKYEG